MLTSYYYEFLVAYYILVLALMFDPYQVTCVATDQLVILEYKYMTINRHHLL